MFWGEPRLSAHEHHCFPVLVEEVNGVECSCRMRKTGVERADEVSTVGRHGDHSECLIPGPLLEGLSLA